MYELVELYLIDVASTHKKAYDTRAHTRSSFQAGNHVWLSKPTAVKLCSRCEGGWTVFETEFRSTDCHNCTLGWTKEDSTYKSFTAPYS